MKMAECKRRNIFKFGFTDPDKVHEKTLQHYPRDTERNLLRFLVEQNFWDSILFPYNFR